MECSSERWEWKVLQEAVPIPHLRFFSLCYQTLLRTEGEEPEAQCSCSLKWIRWSQDMPCK